MRGGRKGARNRLRMKRRHSMWAEQNAAIPRPCDGGAGDTLPEIGTVPGDGDALLRIVRFDRDVAGAICVTFCMIAPASPTAPGFRSVTAT